VTFPGPHPRSTTSTGSTVAIRATRSSKGRARSASKPRYFSGFQDGDVMCRSSQGPGGAVSARGRRRARPREDQARTTTDAAVARVRPRVRTGGCKGRRSLDLADAAPSMGHMTQFRISEAADLLGVSADTVRRWADSGRLAASRDEHGHRIVEGADLAAYLS